MRQTERAARIERLREQIKTLRQHATEGHMPYMVDALELIVDLLEEAPPRHS
jgi:uncharacterized membrane protein YccC